MRQRKWPISRETWAAIDLTPMHISSLRQIPQDDGRKLKGVPQADDPWIAQLFYGSDDTLSEQLQSEFIAWGDGATADDAVMRALEKSKGLEGAYRKLAAELEMTRKLLRAYRTRTQRA